MTYSAALQKITEIVSEVWLEAIAKAIVAVTTTKSRRGTVTLTFERGKLVGITPAPVVWSNDDSACEQLGLLEDK